MTAQPLELHSADIITHPSLPHLSLAKISKITLGGFCICFLAEVKKLSVNQSIWNITRICEDAGFTKLNSHRVVLLGPPSVLCVACLPAPAASRSRPVAAWRRASARRAFASEGGTLAAASAASRRAWCGRKDVSSV